MQFNLSFQTGQSGSGDWLPIIFFAWLVIWLLHIALVLTRSDYDALTRLTWLIVLIFVPFFGVVLYWAVAPDARRRTIEPGDTSGTPWRDDPNHTLKKS